MPKSIWARRDDRITDGDALTEHPTWSSVYALSLLIIVCNIPIISRFFGGYATYLPFLALLAVCATPSVIRIKRNRILFLVCVFIYFGVMILYYIARISTIAWGVFASPFTFFVFYFSSGIAFRADRKQARFLLDVTLLSILLTMVSNVIEYVRYGSVYFNQHVNEIIGINNIISTQYGTGLALMSGIMLIYFLHDRKKNRRLIWLALMLLSVLFNVFVSQRTIAILLTLTMLSLILLFNAKRTALSCFLFFFFLAAAALVLLNYNTALDVLEKVIQSNRVVRRLEQIRRFIVSGDIQSAGGSLTARINLINVTLQTWTGSLKNFLFGVGDHRANNRIIGNHSDLADVLGRYGLGMGIILYYLLIVMLKDTLHRIATSKRIRLYRQVLVVLIVFFVRGLFGGIVVEACAIQLFIVLPLMLNILKEGNQML